METKLEIAINWLPRYTGMPLEKFGDYILITNFKDYVEKFAERFSVEIYGEGRAMQAATNDDGLTIMLRARIRAMSTRKVLWWPACHGRSAGRRAPDDTVNCDPRSQKLHEPGATPIRGVFSFPKTLHRPGCA